MKKARQFKEGDKVFAKVKGYPAWPAVVLGKTGKKINVQFYGTGETGNIKPEDLFYYLSNKNSLMKASKKKEFKDALDEIEKAIAIDGTDGNNPQAEESVASGKRKRSNSERSSDSIPSKKSNTAAVNSESEVESVSNSENVSTKIEEEGESVQDTFDIMDDVETNNTNVDEDLPFIPNIKIISEQNLKNWIIYADQVKANPDLYKSKPVEKRNYSINQVFPIRLPSGKYGGVKLHKTWPLTFADEYECAMYDNDTASRLLLSKDSITKGKVTPETDPDLFLEDFDLTEVEIKRDAEMKTINNKYRRVERLRSESSLVELDAKIKNCLALTKADPKKALELLGNMLEINIDEIMLKKHSHVVEMIRRLRKYIGNVEEWNLSQEELQTFLADAQKLRAKADELYKSFKTIVKLPEETTNFWDGFNNVVAKFRSDCKFLNNREVFVLCAEPYSRQAIIDRLEQEEELQEADIHRPTEAETDKENHSEDANSKTATVEEP